VVVAGLVTASSLLAACSLTVHTTAPANQGPVWLCRPGLPADPCTAELATTVAPGPSPTSSTTVRAAAPPATHPAIDCFYVYPTVSTQRSTNADLRIDPAETVMAMEEASPFAPDCRIYAPMYRQLTSDTVSAAISGTPGVIKVSAASVDLAYGDVQAAWQYYLANDNDGRGVVFIGDSQGSSMLIRLLRSQVDPSPAVRRLLVSAIILGGNVEVLSGQSAGGDFQNIPACNASSATGCVVAYSSANQTPPSDSFFGRAGTGLSLVSGQPSGPSSSFQVLCVNPASLSSPTTPGMLQPYFPTSAFPTSVPSGYQPTAWVTYPNLYSAQCENRNGASWLQVDHVARSGDTRPVVTEVPGPTWGLHLWDFSLGLGNLVTLVHDEAASYAARVTGTGIRGSGAVAAS
jgi:hypothetical protein